MIGEEENFQVQRVLRSEAVRGGVVEPVGKLC